MGGVIFNHTGTVNLLNVTATGNNANGGGNYSCNPNCKASGLGAVLFNLNGTVTIDFSTLAGNSLSGNNGLADNFGPEDGWVYLQRLSGNRSRRLRQLAGVDDKQQHCARHDCRWRTGRRCFRQSRRWRQHQHVQLDRSRRELRRQVDKFGRSDSERSHKSGGLVVRWPVRRTPVLPIGLYSPAYNAAPSCLEADGSTTLGYDERNTARAQFSQCDVGAYEFDGDYIFADGVDVKL